MCQIIKREEKNHAKKEKKYIYIYKTKIEQNSAVTNENAVIFYT